MCSYFAGGSKSRVNPSPETPTKQNVIHIFCYIPHEISESNNIMFGILSFQDLVGGSKFRVKPSPEAPTTQNVINIFCYILLYTS